MAGDSYDRFIHHRLQISFETVFADSPLLTKNVSIRLKAPASVSYLKPSECFFIDDSEKIVASDELDEIIEDESSDDEEISILDLKDFNTFSADESLCTCTISVKRLLKKLVKDGKLELKNKWIQLGNRDDPGETKAEIKIDLYFLQKGEADQNPVGEAQDEPNHSPKLQKPKVGRGVGDFLKGTWLDVTSWKFNFSLMGTLKILIIVAIIVVIFCILFVAPGILIK